jgi:toxin ParE1/3/4
MRYQVVIGAEAERDLEAIHDYIADHDSVADAQRVLDRLLQVVESLESQPRRGSRPRELAGTGRHDYRQVVFKPWRLIYRIVGRQVVIYLVADGRRDMQRLLAERLLGP